MKTGQAVVTGVRREGPAVAVPAGHPGGSRHQRGHARGRRRPDRAGDAVRRPAPLSYLPVLVPRSPEAIAGRGGEQRPADPGRRAGHPPAAPARGARLGWVTAIARGGAPPGHRDAVHQRRRRHPRPDRPDRRGDRHPAWHPGGGGVVTGFAMGLLVELASPVGTLGVLALLYLVIGAWCGRCCSREELHPDRPSLCSRWPPPVVQIGVMIFQLLLGTQMGASGAHRLGAAADAPALTALLSPPVLLVGWSTPGLARRRAVRRKSSRMTRAPAARTGLRAPDFLDGRLGGARRRRRAPRCASPSWGDRAGSLGLLLTRLWFLQVDQRRAVRRGGRGNSPAHGRHRRPRGKVLDRNGELLVGNRTGTDLAVDRARPTGARREQVLNWLAAKFDGVTASDPTERVEAGESRPFESVVGSPVNVRPALTYYLAQRERQFPDRAARQLPAHVPAGPDGHTCSGARGRSPRGDRRLAAAGMRAMRSSARVWIEQQYESSSPRDAGQPHARGRRSGRADRPRGHLVGKASRGSAATSSSRSTRPPRRRPGGARRRGPERPLHGRGGRPRPRHGRGPGAGPVPGPIPRCS